MRKLIYLLALWAPMTSAQCDVEISSWNAATGDITIEAINTENCGCNEFTNEGNTCDNSASPAVNNNTTISHIVLGLHSPGLDYNWGCTGTTNHPGWTFKVFTLFGNQVLESGDSWSANVYDSGSNTNDCWAEMLANDTICMELAIWQINLSQTATTDNGGWAVNPNVANQTQNYPDVNLDGNSVIVCPAIFPGCTDPVALNYNDEATEDDGTCVYSTGPDPIIIDLVVNNEECEVFEVGILSTFNYSATIVNIGTEAVTNFCLNDFLGITFNCFNGVSNLAVWIQPGDTLTVYGNMNVEGTWTAGQGNFMTITSVPGEIITANNNFVFYMPDGVDCEEIVDPEPCDTVYINTIDTLYIDNFITLTDTIIITEFITDTIYNEYVVYEYIYQIDTITEYHTLTQYIDCITGLPCSQSECDETSIYAPTAVTPNADGWNDTWQVIADNCWDEWEVRIYNRWGGLVWISASSNDVWDADVATGVYVYTIKAIKYNPIEVYEMNGYVSVFY